MRLKRARLRQAACFENLDLKASRGLDKGLIRDLFTGRWISQHRHVILTGATGTGKTWIACALGNQAAREGFSVLYTRLSRLLDDIATARLGSGAGALMRRIAKVDLLLVDDWMMSELSATQRRDLMEIVDDRHDRGSIILATQIPLSSWHGAIGDATYADDRGREGFRLPSLRTVRAVLPHTALQSLVSTSGVSRCFPGSVQGEESWFREEGARLP
jgi:DNA replication protein DnaC